MLKSEPPFEEYKVYGPYWHKFEKRNFVALVHKTNGTRTSTSYARYLLCVRERRLLTEYEQADHIDEDKSNDEPSNLQILPSEENRIKSAKLGRTMVKLTCKSCHKTFLREKRQVKPTTKFCSRKCKGRGWVAGSIPARPTIQTSAK